MLAFTDNLGSSIRLAILDEDVQAVLHQQRSVEHNQAEAQRQDIITGAHFEEIANPLLQIPQC
jgi:hypothetical protein